MGNLLWLWKQRLKLNFETAQLFPIQDSLKSHVCVSFQSCGVHAAVGSSGRVVLGRWGLFRACSGWGASHSCPLSKENLRWSVRHRHLHCGYPEVAEMNSSCEHAHIGCSNGALCQSCYSVASIWGTLANNFTFMLQCTCLLPRALLCVAVCGRPASSACLQDLVGNRIPKDEEMVRQKEQLVCLNRCHWVACFGPGLTQKRWREGQRGKSKTGNRRGSTGALCFGRRRLV